MQYKGLAFQLSLFLFMYGTHDAHYNLLCFFSVKIYWSVMLAVKDWLFTSRQLIGEIDSGGHQGSINNLNPSNVHVYA